MTRALPCVRLTTVRKRGQMPDQKRRLPVFERFLKGLTPEQLKNLDGALAQLSPEEQREIDEEFMRSLTPDEREGLERLQRGESGAGIPIDWLLDPSSEIQRAIEDALSKERPAGARLLTEELRQKIEDIKRKNSS